MEYGFLWRAGKFLQEQKKHRRWMAVFLCLAAGVTLGTLGLLKLYGEAMTHQVKVLDCKYEVHVHTDECYTEDGDGEKILICEHADEAEYVVHVHNDDCYDDKGELVCQLEEHERHEHTDDCWEEIEVLVCELEETEGTVSTEPVPTEDTAESSQETEQPAAEPQTELVQICEKEEHEHSDECSPIDCGLEEHSHDDSCVTSVLICETEEHSHEADCYDEEGNLICETEEHVHEEACHEEEYVCGLEEHSHDDSCRTADQACGLEAHIHDDSCYEEQVIETTETVQPAEEEEAVPSTPEETVIIEGHVHTDECYETVRELTCKELELHTHNADPGSEGCCYDQDCFDEEGNLIEGSRPSCGLLQLEEHVHTDDEENPENSCFDILELTDEEVAALNNGATLHVHTEDCYDEEGNLICGHEVTHLHQLACYDEDGHLICGFGGDSHEHDAKCYDEEGNLTCGFEDAKDHEHDAGCYDEEGSLTCGYEGVKAHEHRADCYDEEGSLICGYEGVKDHEHDAGCYNEEGILICSFDDAKVHEHDAGCYDEEGNLICGYEGAADHEHVADCYDIFGNLICGYEGVSDHVHTEECYDGEGNLICGKEVLEIYEQSKAYECGSYIVVARYNDDAEIPEEAEFLAEQITADSDQEHYASRETEYRNELRDETASMRALLKIGFYVGEEDGRVEVEPKTPVAVAVQFLDEDGLAEGKPITIIHFAEDGVERLDGSKAKNNSTSFKMNSFSEIAIGYSPEKKAEINRNGTIHIADDYECDADPFHIVFHVEGDAKAADGSLLTVPVSKTGDTAEDGAEPTGTEEAEDTALSEDQSASAEDSAEDAEESDTDADAPEGEENAVAEHEEDTIVQNLKFHVKSLNDDPEIQKALVDYIGESDNTVSRNILHTISYHMTYEDVELDLSGCTVTAEVTLKAVTSENAPAVVSEQQSTEENNETADDADGAETGSEGGEDTAAEADARESVVTVTTVPENTAVAAGKRNSDSMDAIVVDETMENKEAVQALKNALTTVDTDIEISIMALSVLEDKHVSKLGAIEVGDENQNQNNKMAFTLESSMFALTGQSALNPEFTVQYYAYLDIAERNPEQEKGEVGASVRGVEIIDTSKENESNNGEAILPTNKAASEIATTSLVVEDAGQKGPGSITKLYKVRTGNSLEQIYASEKYNFLEAPGLENFNKYANEYTNYELIEVWVLNEGGDPESKDNKNSDWTVYKNPESLEFTNDSGSQTSNRILIGDNAVIRLVSDSKTGEDHYPALFYDYDITNGKVYSDKSLLNEETDREKDIVYYAGTKMSGINSESNYQNNGNPRLGFGNGNVGNTGLDFDMKGGYFINKATDSKNEDGEAQSGAFGGCSFGIVANTLGEDGYPEFNVDAPDIFGPTDLPGKTLVKNYWLDFKRSGDTYTLTSVNDGSSTVVNNLDLFGWRGNWNKTKDIWTNNFWPMDSAETFGAPGHDLKFGLASIAGNRIAVGQDSKPSFPVSDDDIYDHNSYFGMSFAIDFNLTRDYLGPLNYYFFGDDDMWVFLDGRLICDIGGVHSSAGEYVDLWDYIEKGSEGKHTLKFFYTERGASGSTCWMQFTLPSVNVVPVDYPSGKTKNTLTVEKSVSGADTEERFEFEVIFFDKTGQTELFNNYDYKIMEKGSTEPVESGGIRSHGKFYLGDGQSIIIGSLPEGTHYTIKETKYDGYKAEIDGTIIADSTVEGTIDYNRDDGTSYVNQAVPYDLPETGGPGPIWYMIAGAFFILLGTGLMYNKKFSERRV